jgi:hypothetical protein
MPAVRSIRQFSSVLVAFALALQLMAYVGHRHADGSWHSPADASDVVCPVKRVIGCQQAPEPAPEPDDGNCAICTVGALLNAPLPADAPSVIPPTAASDGSLRVADAPSPQQRRPRTVRVRDPPILAAMFAA